ncbi:platelet-activating factor acetylhydrolase, partial [Elsinoe ampelina]
LMSFLSRLSPVPSFPPLPGPYQVGTVDVEIAAEDLHSPVPKPDGASATVAYRIFYPCEKTTTYARPVRWIQSPQRENLAGFIKYMGVGDRVAGIVAALPTPISHISLPATRSAPLLPSPPSPSLFPLTLFSHGLAGSRNLYSHLCSSLSSHGQIVIAPSHRDGSAPVAHVRATPSSPAQTIPSITIPYAAAEENYAARDRQLRIRCWEAGLIYDSLLRVHRGEQVGNLDPNPGPKGERDEVLARFKGRLDLRPGRVTWAGHSFGAATVVQFVKSVFWREELAGEQKKGEGLFPVRDGEVVRQVSRETRLVLLDPWMMPILSPFQRGLRGREIPAFTEEGEGGRKVLAIVSEGFWKWKQNLEEVRRLLRPKRGEVEAGRAWYAVGSRHFSQSDFGVLFSWLLERFSKAANGRELLEGNVRLINEMLRDDGVELAGVENLQDEKKEG